MKAETHPRFAKLFDQLLGLSLFGWAVAGMVSAWPDWQAIVPVRLGLALLQVWVGILIITRPPAIVDGGLRDIVICLPSFMISGLLFHQAGPLYTWPLACKWVFAGGIVWVIASFWSLRRSFAILPARRALVRTGMYKLVRHPAYLGELVMACACAVAAGSPWAWMSLVGLVGWIVVRIRREEQLLLEDAGYGEYAGEVRWRLVRGVW